MIYRSTFCKVIFPVYFLIILLYPDLCLPFTINLTVDQISVDPITGSANLKGTYSTLQIDPDWEVRIAYRADGTIDTYNSRFFLTENGSLVLNGRLMSAREARVDGYLLGNYRFEIVAGSDWLAYGYPPPIVYFQRDDYHKTMTLTMNVPEPSTMLLLVMGLVGFAGYSRTRFIK